MKQEEIEFPGSEKLRAALEAVFFAADEPLSRDHLHTIFPDETQERIERTVRQMALDFAGEHRGFHLAEVGGGFQFRTNPDFNSQVLRLFEAKPVRLSRAALETLAIVAYRQPVTRATVDEIRGVDSAGIIKRLSELELITVVGRMDDIGRPNLFGTTQRFLEFFGLKALTDLPTLDEFNIDLEILGEVLSADEEE
jgi:segregation and condensation protein B